MKLNELLSPELYAQVQAEIDKINAEQPDKTKHVRFADLSEGGYVSVEKFNDHVNTLTQQITDLNGQLAQRDTDMADLNEKLTAAQADATKLTEAQNALTTLQTKYSTDRQAWEAAVTKQKYDFMVQERASALKFTSNAAKRDFIREATGKEFKVDGDTLLGYEDFVTKYKADNPGALVETDPTGASDPTPPNQPTIVLPKTKPSEPEKAVFGFHFNGVRPKPVDET